MSKTPAVLTIDIGLTNCKVSLFDFQGQALADVSRPYPTHAPQVGWSEQHIDDWWAALRQGIRALVEAGRFEAVEIAVISVTAHMHGLVAVDRDGAPLTSCWTLFDRRAEAEAEQLNRDLGLTTAYHITGGRLEAYTPAAKIAWITRHMPEIARRTHKFLAPKDALRLRLCGELVTDPLDAAGSLLYDLRGGMWSDQIVSAVGIQSSQLPDVRRCMDIAGQLSAQAARELNLKAGIPVVVGAGDDVEALGAGIVRAGQALEHIGTTGTLICCTSSYVEDENQRIEVYPHVIPGLYLVGGATNAAGRSLDWIRKILFQDREQPRHVPLEYPGTGKDQPMPVFLPYILGERGVLWNNQATGMFFGLRESHSAYDLARAVYEGVAFSLRQILDQVIHMGVPVNELISGSMTEIPAWSQLRADMYGIEIHFPRQPNVTGIGAAMLGMVGIQAYESLQAAAQHCTRLQDTVASNAAMKAHFDQAFARYERIVSTVDRLF